MAGNVQSNNDVLASEIGKDLESYKREVLKDSKSLDISVSVYQGFFGRDVVDITLSAGNKVWQTTSVKAAKDKISDIARYGW